MRAGWAIGAVMLVLAVPSQVMAQARIYFEQGSVALSAEARATLDNWTPQIVALEAIDLIGHADASEGAAAAELVAVRRAEAIAGLLTPAKDDGQPDWDATLVLPRKR